MPHALSWHEVDSIVRRALLNRVGEKNAISEEDVAFGTTLGLLFLKTDYWELKRLSQLPDVLEWLGLFSASAALIYALGYEDELRDTLFREAGEDEDMHAFFIKWRDQAASVDLPEKPALYEEGKVTLKSHLLGCDIRVESENVSPCVEVAESVLAALESLLSTGTIDLMAAREPVLTMAVRRSEFARPPFEFEVRDQTGRPHINITCAAFDPHSKPIKAHNEFRDKLLELIAITIGSFVISNDLSQVLERLVRDELALDRSLNFTGSFKTVANVFGHDPKSRISSWSDPKAREYPPKRAHAWDEDDIRAEERLDAKTPPTPGVGEPPSGLRDLSNVRQTEIRTVSLIRESLWDKAKWSATVFATAADGASPPIMALAFKDEETAKQIFALWLGEFGTHDSEERLRIAIVRGINKDKPCWYRVLVGSNPAAGFSSVAVRYAVFVSRINTMRPESDANLERFMRSYERFKNYFLMAAVWKGDAFEPELMYDTALFKRELFVRWAWEIGRHDTDGAAIHGDDTPVIPVELRNPPILELLQRKQEGKRS